MDYFWVVLAAFAGISSNLSNFMNRYILIDDQDSSAFAWFYETFRMLFFIPLIFLYPLPKLTPHLIISLLVVGLIEFISVILWMRMFAFTHLSISAIISRTRLIWIPLIAFFILGESLRLNDYLGIGILFVGLSIAVAPNKIAIDKGIKYSYASALFASFFTVGLKYLSTIASIPVITVAVSLPSALLFPLLIKNPKERILRTLKTKIWLKIGATLFNIAAIYLLILALTLGPVGTVNGIYQSMMLVSIFLGITVLKEIEDIWKKILGSSIAIVGIILLSVI